jgi:predicted metal-dependent hydrolase
MNTESHRIIVNGMRIDVVRKPIKNLHLGVYPPNGRIRVAVPLRVSDEAVRLAVVSRLAWIKRQTAKFESQDRQSAREYVSGESHYYLGRRFRLHVIEGAGPRGVEIRSNTLDVHVPKGSISTVREALFLRWQRARLRALAYPIIEQWADTMGVTVAEWGIKRMKTRWGTCNVDAHRIWLNLELIKKSPQCIEYIVVHELTHFLERHHNDRFIKLMDEFLPKWRSYREELNAAPLAHEDWQY